MADNTRKVIILDFSKTFVTCVSHISIPGMNKAPDKNELSLTLMKPLKTFLDRHKMEMFFLYREQMAKFKDELDEITFKKMLELIMDDFTDDKYNSTELSCFCIVVSFFAAVARKYGIPTTLKVATRIIFDAIEHFEKDDIIKGDILKDIINSLNTMAEKIISQNMSYIEENE